MIRWPILLALLLMIGGNQLRGQQGGQQGPALELGVRGETGGGIGPQRLPGTPDCPDCGTNGTTTERRINFSVGLFLPNGRNNDFGFRLRAGGTFVTGTSVSDPYALGLVVVDSGGTPIPAQIEYSIDYSPTQFQFEFLGEYAPAPWARIFAGPWGALRLNEPYIQTERIVQPSGARFLTGQERRTVASGSEVSPARGTFGVVLGGGVRWKVAPRLTLLPDLFARLTFDVRGDVIGVATATVGGGVGLQVDLLPPAPPPLPPDTLPPLLPPPSDTSAVRPSGSQPVVDSSQAAAAAQAFPTATVDLVAVDSAGNQTEVAHLGSRLVRHIRCTMIPPTVDCNQLPPMLTAANHATPQWSLDSLVSADHNAVQQRVLLAFALRLRGLPSARLMMKGGSSDCRNQLRSAMVGMLQVEPGNLLMSGGERGGKISVSAAGEGGKELLVPITSEWFVEDIQEPAFSVIPTMSAEAGVRRWEIVVRQQGLVITSRSSDGANGGEATATDPMLLRQPDGGAPPPLVATFTVEDSAGRITTAVDSLPVISPVPMPINYKPGRWEQEVIDLLLEPNPTGSQQWKQVLHGYLPAIQTGASVKVVGNRNQGNQVLAELRQAMLRGTKKVQIEFVEHQSEGVQVVIRQGGK
ncbi:MAG: hypothetical protein IT211_04460 [Armatimonadetes bacterium]|nr:hypothetical protein [Armatimonadota bacterium]